MKTYPILKIAALTLGLGLSAPFTAITAAEPNSDRLPPERFEAKVIKVISASDGPAVFRAYIVMWKGQEVVASDTLAKSRFKEGDVITVLAMNHPYPQDKEPHRLLSFSIVPPPKQPGN